MKEVCKNHITQIRGPVQEQGMKRRRLSIVDFQESSEDVDWLCGGAVVAEPELGRSNARTERRGETRLNHRGKNFGMKHW